MPPEPVRGLIGDTCFWIAAFDPGDDNYARAAKLLADIRAHVVLMPWPITYEVLRTQTVRDPRKVAAFARMLRELKVLRVDDAPFRDRCLELTLGQAVHGRRAISLVDMVVRQVILERHYRITRLLTFNAGDFHDVCRECHVAIWPEGETERR